MSCQMAMAFRLRASPCSISSRYGSQALGERSGGPESVVTCMAGFEGSGSVVTPMAGFAGARRPTHPAGAPLPRLLLGKRLLFLDGHQWLAGCAATAIR